MFGGHVNIKISFDYLVALAVENQLDAVIARFRKSDDRAAANALLPVNISPQNHFSILENRRVQIGKIYLVVVILGRGQKKIQPDWHLGPEWERIMNVNGIQIYRSLESQAPTVSG